MITFACHTCLSRKKVVVPLVGAIVGMWAQHVALPCGGSYSSNGLYHGPKLLCLLVSSPQLCTLIIPISACYYLELRKATTTQ